MEYDRLHWLCEEVSAYRLRLRADLVSKNLRHPGKLPGQPIFFALLCRPNEDTGLRPL